MAATQVEQPNEALHNIYIKPPRNLNSLRSRGEIYGMCDTAAQQMLATRHWTIK
jgi:hypothetical protein